MLDGLDVAQLRTLLEWMDGNPAYADLCDDIRARIERLMRMN